LDVQETAGFINRDFLLRQHQRVSLNLFMTCADHGDVTYVDEGKKKRGTPAQVLERLEKLTAASKTHFSCGLDRASVQ
jgi:hypothetical protein